MIRIFRKHTQHLTTNWFNYGLDTIVVIVGILIALAMNNWNENRKARIQEIKYLKNLQVDLLTEQKRNEDFVEYRRNKAKSAALLLNYPNPISIDDHFNFERMFTVVVRWNRFIPTNNTFKELSSSGNLSFITNDSIKYYLLELDKMYENILSWEHHMRREYEEYLYDVFIPNTEILNYGDFEYYTETGNLKFEKPENITKENLETYRSEARWILNNKTIKNGLKLATMNNSGLKNKHTELGECLIKLNSLIIEDLQKK